MTRTSPTKRRATGIGRYRTKSVRSGASACARGAVAAIGVVMGCAACGGHHHSKVAVPGSPPFRVPTASMSSASPTSRPSTPKPSGADAVAAAYAGYVRVSNQAVVLPIEQARSVLSGYATGPVISDEIRGIQQAQTQHHELWGYEVPHPYQIAVTDHQAELQDCKDISHAALADNRTHQVIPSTRPKTPYTHLQVTLERGGDGRWRVSSVRYVESPCQVPTAGSPAPSG